MWFTREKVEVEMILKTNYISERIDGELLKRFKMHITKNSIKIQVQ